MAIAEVIATGVARLEKMREDSINKHKYCIKLRVVWAMQVTVNKLKKYELKVIISKLKSLQDNMKL